MSIRELSSSDVDNVFVYVGDAVRWDTVPDQLLNKGFAVKSVASGMHSPTSFASIVSGTYQPQHKVGDFRDKIDEHVPNLLHLKGVNTAFINSINHVRFDPESSEDIIAKTLDTDSEHPDVLESINEPFLVIERGPGGHAPYVRTDGRDTGKAYFESKGSADRSEYRQDYNEAVSEDVDWFCSRMEALSERGILDNTLIVYTSDHGELLGETGAIAHSAPMHPNHVYVPSIFIHRNLSTKIQRERLFRHVDIAPTVSSLLGSDFDVGTSLDGRDLTRTSMAERGATFHGTRKQLRSVTVQLNTVGVWDSYGGVVLPRSSPLVFLMIASYRLLKSPWRQYARENLISYLQSNIAGDRVYGTPEFSISDAREWIEKLREEDADTDTSESLNVSRERLEELGYLQ
jgi:arylsulfatase A-like enzyme